MFQDLSSEKLSTKHQNASLLYYPGATAEGILKRMQKDIKFQDINPIHIDRIYLLCGTNNVDRILSVPKSDWTNLLSYNQYRVNPSLLEQATWDISNLVAFLHGWAVSATINIVNILPRVSRVRNLVINDLNTHIWDISNRLSYVNVVDTEYDRNLFSDRDSFRKNIYFNGKGSDNVHLNTLGIARLAKHLKYWAHH